MFAVPASKVKVVVEPQALVWQYCSFHPVTVAPLDDTDQRTSSCSWPLPEGTVTVTSGRGGGGTSVMVTVTACSLTSYPSVARTVTS